MKIIKILIYFSWLALLAAAIYDIFHQPARIVIWLGSLAILMIIYFKSRLPLHYNLLLSFIVILNLCGELVVLLYYKTSFYDKILHFLVPVLFFPIIYYFAKEKIKNKKTLILFCICAIITLSVLWEIIEFGIDKNSDTLMQGVYFNPNEHFFWLYERQLQDKNNDTMMDLIFNTLGSLVGGFICLLKNKKSA